MTNLLLHELARRDDAWRLEVVMNRAGLLPSIDAEMAIAADLACA